MIDSGPAWLPSHNATRPVTKCRSWKEVGVLFLHVRPTYESREEGANLKGHLAPEDAKNHVDGHPIV